MSLNKLRNIFKKLFKTLIILLLVLIPTGLFLVGTTSGLKLDLYLFKKITGATLSIKEVQGNLAKKLSVKEVHYKTADLDLKIKQLNLSWSMLKSLYSGIKIIDLELDEVVFKLNSAQDSNKKQVKTTSDFKYISQQDIKMAQDLFFKSLSKMRFNLQNIKIKQFKFIDQKHNVLLKSLVLNSLSNKDGLLIKEFKAQFLKQNIQATGFITYNNNFPIKINLTSNGLVKSTSKLIGTKGKYSLSSNFSKPFKASLNIHITKDININADLNIGHGYWPLQGKKQVSIPKLNLSLKSQSSNYNLLVNGQLKLANLASQHFSLTANGNHSDFKLKSNFGANKLKLNGKYSLPIAIDLNIPFIHKLLPQVEFIHAAITAKGTISKNSQAVINLSSGYLDLGKHQNLNFKASTINLNQNNKSLLARGIIKIDLFKSLKLNISLPNFKLGSLKRQLINGNIEFNFNNISMIDKFISDLKNSQGQLHGQVRLNGLITSPKLSLNLNLKKAKTQIERLGLKLQNININLSGSPKRYNLKGSLHSGPGILNLNGTANLLNEHFNSKLKLSGTNVTLFNTDEYKININPDLLLTSDNQKINLNGKIYIPKAVIAPHDFSSTVELPDDVKILGKAHKRSNSLDLTYQVGLTLGEDIDLSVLGLTGKLQGNLKVDAPLNQPTIASGTLSVTNGKFNAYGQHLNVNRGELTYTANPLNNPGIYIEASRTFNYQSQYSPNPNQSFDSNHLDFNDFSSSMTVGINITGRLKSPKVTLFSNPSTQNQADILSMIILGKPISQGSSGGGSSQLLLSALSSLNLGGGSNGQQLTDQLQHAFGLDELGIETQATYNSDTNTVEENTALVIGKSLSSKLSLNYSIGLGQASNILRIKYKFSPKWSLQIETSTNTSGLDILYNYSKTDKKM